MPVESCGNGKWRIGDGPCMYTSEENANEAYRAHLAQKETTYNDYPEAASNNAKRAIKYKEENGSSCGTEVGWTRARQLANREKLTRETIARMASFKRHQANKDVPYSEGCGGIMWDAWGGDAGINWAIAKLKEIDAKEENMIYTYKNLSLEIKDVDVKQGIVTGYFSAFDIKDSDGDIIRPGAFSRSIKEWFPKGRIKHLLNHNPTQAIGKLTDLKEDDYGLYYESKIGKHNLGQDFLKMVDSELIKEHSIGFQTINKKKVDGATEITDVKLWEGSSLTSWGANEFTPLTSVKSMVDIDTHLKRLEKFVRNTDATDEAIDLCLLEIKQLYQLVHDLSSKPAVEEAPVQQKEEGFEEAINLLILKHF